ncbi:hypothetical protein M427DRAFT_138969 [Gonapodya prolifera JEL478]|uniref:SURF6-domain-containing protein n=1 Tax=Gonapodya prolifera (strain JEL478) TaxID=1344416 RepID=A0A139A1P0_GONPJ|nr:hypothetical protein M427DRAFT_138969 [Gonapodya prolifera JEL478]|eukprot:KXS10696.1 hypothetical protein M427DRAFT_138969 [Gonapodya prolifera JEL478]
MGKDADSAVSAAMDELATRISHHVAAFDSLVSLIPPAFYIPKKETADDDAGGRFAHNKKRKAPKQDVKEATKKAKRARLDPDNAKTVLDFQKEELQNRKAAPEDDDGSDASEDYESADDMSDSDTEEHTEPPTSHKTDPTRPSGLPPAATPSDLRARLQARIAQLRAKRNASPVTEARHGSPNSRESSPRSKDDLIQARRVKKKQEKKAKKVEAKERKKEGKGGAGAGAGAGVMGVKVEGPVAKNGNASSSSSSSSRPAPIADDLSFGALAIPTTATGTPSFKSTKHKTTPTSSTSASQQLVKLAAQRAKLDEMRDRGESDKADAIEEKAKWTKLQALAEGEKVKDDAKLLHKTVRREQKAKQKSRKEWSARHTTETHDQKERQAKRRENIELYRKKGGAAGKALKAANKAKAKAQGKKPSRPGFEGSFLQKRGKGAGSK